MTTNDDRFHRFNVQMKEGDDYYMENGYRVLMRSYLIRRGYCCGNGCRHCPYFPKHIKGNKNIDDS
ncbi:MAG: DUF5522 domain-containing protein [Bacteroidales bacterium]|nr:DUF5522 domain-containing protein [Bacteroidales bacterium]